MQEARGNYTHWRKLRWIFGGLGLLGLLLIGQGGEPAEARVPALPTATITVDSTVTATPTVDSVATAMGNTATAVSRTATALSGTATAQAAQGTVVSIGATQTALAATITALASTPLATRTPAPTATSTATPVPCLDSYEPDGEPEAARPLVVGEQQAHFLCPAGDADWVTFFAKTGKAYRLATSDLSPGVDTYMYLFAPDGRTVLAQNDDAPGAHGPSLVVWIPPADGWYFLQIKNQGDIGAPGLAYTLSLSLADAPTATLTSTAAPSATPPLLSSTPTFTVSPPLPPTAVPSALPTLSATPDPLLHPQTGSAGTGGVPVIDAGPTDGLAADLLEPDDRFETARPLDLGVVYQHLNFVPATIGVSDADFYSFRTKPGNCYALTTGDLTAGLDTTILLWTAAPTREGRRLLGQNDDARPHTADLSSFVRWCNPLTGPDDRWLVAEIHNYGLAPAADPRGKTYSLIVQIDPPTTTPSPTPRPPPVEPSAPLPPVPGGGVGDGSGSSGNPVSTPVPVLPAPAPPPTQSPPTPVPILPTPTTVPAESGAPPRSPIPAASPTPAATATPTPVTVQVDVVAYVAPTGDLDPQRGPQPDDGIQGVAVVLIDGPTNAVLQTALTDRNGHAALRWIWSGPVRIALPAFRWGRSLSWEDVQRESQGAGRLYLEARTPGYALPGIFP